MLSEEQLKLEKSQGQKADSHRAPRLQDHEENLCYNSVLSGGIQQRRFDPFTQNEETNQSVVWCVFKENRKTKLLSVACTAPWWW